MHGLLVSGLGLKDGGKPVITVKSSSAESRDNYYGTLIFFTQHFDDLQVAVPPGIEVILKSTSRSISPSVMVAHTSLKVSISLRVVYSTALKAMVIPMKGF